MSNEEKEAFLTPIIVMLFLMELEYIGGFSKAQSVPFDFDTYRDLWLSYFGWDADDFNRNHAFWFNSSEGSGKTCFGVKADRPEMTMQMVMYTIASLCKFDPDETLRDEHAKLYNLAGKDHFAVINDHCGGKNCEPGVMKQKSLIFMLNEMCSYLAPLRDVTDAIRGANQDIVAGETKKKHCMIERDFKPKGEYSEARKRELTAYSKQTNH